jgi:hypothetical protein
MKHSYEALVKATDAFNHCGLDERAALELFFPDQL